MRRTRLTASMFAVALAVGVVAPASGALSAPDGVGGGDDADRRESPDASVGGQLERSRTVTLITGDRVTLTTFADERQAIEVEAAPGRERIGFVEQVVDGRYRVVPGDALPLLGAGRLDPRLFDVTLLAEHGYHDEERDELPLIVGYDDRQRSAAKRTLVEAGATVVNELPSIDGAALTVDTSMDSDGSGAVDFWDTFVGDFPGGDATATAAEPAIELVWLDGPVETALDESVPQIGAPTAWDAGLTGAGVRVAVLDTGIDTSHPDLADAVVAEANFTEWSDTTDDLVGHGTHVASIAASRGAVADGRYRGVAPDAELLNGKVLDDSGGAFESWIIAGMEWAATEQDADIVNMSLGGCATDGTDPVSRALDALTDQTGALFVVAAGNHPAACAFDEIVSTPASADLALAVGSVDKADSLSAFSNVGPRLGDHALKPELTAPGEGIVAAAATEAWIGEPVGEDHLRISGTSMAAPHVAGAAALLVQRHPDWDADELRSALMANAEANPELSVFQQGAGRLDVGAAIDASVLASPAGVSMVAAWPHDGDVLTETVTYTNTTDAPITLDLTIEDVGPGGATPDGMFAVAPNRLEVPADGTASVKVTADPSTVDPGEFGALVTASAGGDPVARTPIGLVKEVESYDLTIDLTDRDGDPTASELFVVDVEDSRVMPFEVGPEPTRLRLPAGTYDLMTTVWGIDPDSGDSESLTLVAYPDLRLDADTALELDARTGEPVEVELTDAPSAVASVRRAAVSDGHTWVRIGTDVPDFDLYATPTSDVAGREFEFVYTGALAEPEPTPNGSLPRGYHLYLFEPGGIPGSPQFRVSDADLVPIHTTLHGQGIANERTDTLSSTFEWPIGSGFLYGQGFDVLAPGRRIELYSPGVEWNHASDTDHGHELDYFYQVYELGKRLTKGWNAAPITPAVDTFYGYGGLHANLMPFSTAQTRHRLFGVPSEPGISYRATLERNGEPVGEADDEYPYFEVDQDDEATFTLRTRATRDVAWSTLGTEVEAAWTFTGPFEPWTAGVDAMMLKFDGELDLLNRAKANRRLPLTIDAERVSSIPAEIERLTVEVSFDDGVTWEPLHVRRAGGGFRVMVPKAPAGAEFVSLRASATGTEDNSVEQTVIRAYGLK